MNADDTDLEAIEAGVDHYFSCLARNPIALRFGSGVAINWRIATRQVSCLNCLDLLGGGPLAM